VDYLDKHSSQRAWVKNQPAKQRNVARDFIGVDSAARDLAVVGHIVA
jgi:hypothetical protein